MLFRLYKNTFRSWFPTSLSLGAYFLISYFDVLEILHERFFFQISDYWLIPTGQPLLLKITLLDLILSKILPLIDTISIFIKISKSFINNSLSQTFEGQKYFYLLIFLKLLCLPWNVFCVILSVYFNLPLRLLSSTEFIFTPAVFFVSFPRPFCTVEISDFWCKNNNKFCSISNEAEILYHTIVTPVLKKISKIYENIGGQFYNDRGVYLIKSQYGYSFLKCGNSGWNFRQVDIFDVPCLVRSDEPKIESKGKTRCSKKSKKDLILQSAKAEDNHLSKIFKNIENNQLGPPLLTAIQGHLELNNGNLYQQTTEPIDEALWQSKSILQHTSMRFLRILTFKISKIFKENLQENFITKSMTGCPSDENTIKNCKKAVGKIKILRGYEDWPR